jgi:hypothetical protein
MTDAARPNQPYAVIAGLSAGDGVPCERQRARSAHSVVDARRRAVDPERRLHRGAVDRRARRGGLRSRSSSASAASTRPVRSRCASPRSRRIRPGSSAASRPRRPSFCREHRSDVRYRSIVEVAPHDAGRRATSVERRRPRRRDRRVGHARSSAPAIDGAAGVRASASRASSWWQCNTTDGSRGSNRIMTGTEARLSPSVRGRKSLRRLNA